MTTYLEFNKFPSIPRLNRDCVITEKVDGTNGQIVFDANGNLLVGSRKTQIWPEGTIGLPKKCDNKGFAQWCYKHHEELFKYLGEGRHYGEWAGAGIGRKYGLDHKRFFLFNSHRWGEKGQYPIPHNLSLEGLSAVPVLYTGPFSTEVVNATLQKLQDTGSHINSFKKPEGIIVYHLGSQSYFKITYDFDKQGKSWGGING